MVFGSDRKKTEEFYLKRIRGDDTGEQGGGSRHSLAR